MKTYAIVAVNPLTHGETVITYVETDCLQTAEDMGYEIAAENGYPEYYEIYAEEEN